MPEAVLEHCGIFTMVPHTITILIAAIGLVAIGFLAALWIAAGPLGDEMGRNRMLTNALDECARGWEECLHECIDGADHERPVSLPLNGPGPGSAKGGRPFAFSSPRPGHGTPVFGTPVFGTVE